MNQFQEKKNSIGVNFTTQTIDSFGSAEDVVLSSSDWNSLIADYAQTFCKEDLMFNKPFGLATHTHTQTQTKLNTPEESRQGWQRQVWDLIERFVSCYLIGRPLQAGGYRLMKFTCCCASDWSSNQPRRRCYPYVQRLGCSAVEWARAGAFPFGGADLTIENRPGCHSERARQQSARSG